jgi:hypothetical protein
MRNEMNAGITDAVGIFRDGGVAAYCSVPGNNFSNSFVAVLLVVFRSRIIFMRLRLWVQILMRLRLLPYSIARQNF